MPNRWVYRRPAALRRRRFVPHTFAASHAVIVRRRRVRARRRWLAPRRPVVLGVAAAAPAAAGHVVVRHIRPHLPRRVAPARRRALPGGVTPTTGGLPPPSAFGQVLRSIARARRAMQRRLRFRPKPEDIPPIIVPSITLCTSKGAVMSPGLIRGRVVGA